MSGTINLALSQQFDAQGVPLSGGLLYIFTAGTTTPQSSFQDTGLTIEHPNPIVLDASGRVPMFYLADGFIKIRLTDDTGVVIIAADQLLVIGPSSGGGGGGGGAGDVTAALQTGDIKARYDTAAKDGFVRCNGLTIGNVGSSATERQEAVCQPLFEYLWPFIPPGAPGSTGVRLDGFAKGANALADWGAGRRLILPDLRGRTIAGLDDMGAPAALRLTTAGLGVGVSGTVLGNAGGSETRSLLKTNIPNYTIPSTGLTSSAPTISITDPTHTHANSLTDPSHTHTENFPGAGGSIAGGSGFASASGTSGASTTGITISNAAATTGITASASVPTIGGSVNSGGGGTLNGIPPAFGITPPAMVLTFYMKM